MNALRVIHGYIQRWITGFLFYDTAKVNIMWPRPGSVAERGQAEAEGLVLQSPPQLAEVTLIILCLHLLHGESRLSSSSFSGV